MNARRSEGMKAPFRKARRLIGRLSASSRPRAEAVSTDHALIDPQTAAAGPFDGWHTTSVARRQDAAYRVLIQEMYAGRPRQDFVAAAEAVRLTGKTDDSILEVGCGSGYYSEILSHLLKRRGRYVGVDYSPAMISLAQKHYPSSPFVVGDAIALPFADGAVETVLNGVSLMHVLRYELAVAESRRVARRWCIFHTVPVLQSRETTILRKSAYGQPTIEIIFNEVHLCHLLEQQGLAVRHHLKSVPYSLDAVLGEPTVTRTYVCEVKGQ
jgi:ubiquinone/menaquinone biosynthesis C-methylase UbiE